ncbi:MAG TPA: DUF881 domain-containing protein [Candidatus Angelobacter sp.]|nr:DUF881 domain-containing protein [Candidatus Angelobacter sp.]
MSRRLPGRRRLTRPQWAISIAAALAIIGFIGAAQWNSSLARQEFVTSAQRVLVGEAEQAQRQQESLRAQIEEAELRLREFQRRDEGSRTAQERLNQEVVAARYAAGLTAVAGPGVVIEIADSVRPIPAGERDTNYLVLEDDVRNLVTALWASGAEAIAIAGGGDAGPRERLVATTSIYGVGASILVNTAFLSPPFRIEAVGPVGMHDRFLAHPNYLLRVLPRIEAFGLQFASEARDEVQLPAFVGNTRLRYGAPVLEAAE